MKTMFLAAAAATAMLVAAPALAAPAANDRVAQGAAAQPNAAPPAAAKPMKKSMRHTSTRHAKHPRHKHVSRMDQSRYDRSAAYRDEWNRPMRTGFAPLDFAGNVAGSAIGTAGAIAGAAVGTAGAVAAAPFGVGPYGYRNAYAYAPGYADTDTYDVPYRYDGTAIQYSANYAARNGFVCQPGTWYTNSFGQRQICQ